MELDTSKINEILNYYGLKTNIEETKKWIKQYASGALTGITTSLMINGTYEQIKGWRDNNNLKPGMLYRMTDYVTKVYSEDGSISSAEHPFDLILFADTTDTLNENAFTILHNGDEYFSNSDLCDWEVKYCIDNDDERFGFADLENGKGVIYYLKDEFNNEAPYDFKNILQNDGDYTFGKLDEDYTLDGYVNGVYNNKILPQVDSDSGKQVINKIRVTEKGCNSNLFKPTCVNTYINFTISECDISMNDDGELVVAKTADFISGIENHPIDENPLRQYLTFEAVNDNTEIIFKTYVDYPQYTRTIEVSKDKVNWETKTSSSEGVILGILNAGEKLYLRGNNDSYGYYYEDWDETLCNFILPLNYCYVYGNVMSLIRSTGFASLTELTEDYALYSLFNDYLNGDYSGEYVLSHQDKKLELPATTLAEGCYDGMFRGCTSLTTAPVLPATTLATSCYSSMFYNCTNLTTAPSILPATTLAFGCYESMFRGCSSLTTAPALPATTLADYCYEYMFSECTSLTTAPELPATTLTSNCYQYMFNACTSLATAPELPATTLTSNCYYGMFYNCTSLTTAPELPATTLTDYCYLAMFGSCSSLNYIKCLATNISASYCTDNWVNGVASGGLFEKNPDATWPIGSNGIPSGWTVHVDIDTNNYITVTALEDNSVFGLAKLSTNQILYYYDNNDSIWYQITDTGFSISLESGDTINLCGKLIGNNSSSNYTQFKTTSGKFNISGNINSIWSYDDLNQPLKQYCGYNLFIDCSGLIDVSGFTLPATTLAQSCYSGMFYGCSSLTTAPVLPATTLAQSCYSSMFRNCTSLTTAPELPATTLTNNCYSYMFSSCSSLTTAPMLPATTLAYRCYYYMFNNCSSLTTAPELSATTLASDCCRNMFQNCSRLTTAPELPATTLAESCYSYMFYNCTNLTTAPELPATTLAEGCYKGMFSNCSSLTTAPALPATTLADSCYYSMFQGCSSLTTAPELPATTLVNRCYEYMFYYCSSLTTAPELPATTLTDYCYLAMFGSCSSLNYVKCLAINGINWNYSTLGWVNGAASSGTFVKHQSATSWTTGVNGIPTNWTVEDAS